MSAGGASNPRRTLPSDGLIAASSPHSTPVPAEAFPDERSESGVRRTGPAVPKCAAWSATSGARPCAAINAVIVSGSRPAWVTGSERSAVVPPTRRSASAAAASAVPASVGSASGAKSTDRVSPATRIGCAPPAQATSMRRLRAGEGRSPTSEESPARISAATVMVRVYAGAKRARILT